LRLHLLHDVRVLRQSEPVSDTFRAQQECINEVPIGIRSSIEGFATVKEERDIETLCFTLFLEFQEFEPEGFQRMAQLFLSDNVEP
jgi:hypothetical protein